MDERKVSAVVRGETIDKLLDEVCKDVKYDVRDMVPSINNPLGKETLYLVDIRIREITDELLKETL